MLDDSRCRGSRGSRPKTAAAPPRARRGSRRAPQTSARAGPRPWPTGAAPATCTAATPSSPRSRVSDGSEPCGVGAEDFEIPKSRTLIIGDPSTAFVRKRLAGLRSRCTRPARVRFGERLARLEHVVDGVDHVERAVVLHRLGEVAPLEVLHHDVRRAGVEAAHVGDRRNVWGSRGSPPRGPLGRTGRPLRGFAALRATRTSARISCRARCGWQQPPPPMPPAPSTRLDPVSLGEDVSFTDRRRHALPARGSRGPSRPHPVGPTFTPWM